MMNCKNGWIFAFLFAIPASAMAQNVPRTTSNADYGFSGNRRWAGVSRNSSATTSYDPQSKKASLDFHHTVSGVLFGKEFILGDIKANGDSRPQGMHSTSWVQFGGIVASRSDSDGGLNLAWNREAVVKEYYNNFIVWGIPVTVGARAGLAFGANLQIAPDFSRPNAQTSNGFPNPVRASGSVSARAFVTLSAGLGGHWWGAQVFIGVEATLNLLNGSIGMDVTSGAVRDWGSVWLDFQAVSGEVAAVARLSIQIKVFGRKIGKTWSKSVSLFRFATRPVRKYLLQFGA